MNELVHDLTSALEESELKIESDEDIADRCARANFHKRIKRLGFSDEDLSIGFNVNTKKPVKLNLPACNKSRYSKIKCKIIDSCSGSDTESAFALPKQTMRKHRRRKTRRMETESDTNFVRVEKKELNKKNQTVKNMDLEISNNYVSSLKQFDIKSDEESDISASEESNNEISGQVKAA